MLARVALLLGLMALPARAEVSGEPGSCNPPCRSGFNCRAGRCVSLCNPPCNPGERCDGGECVLMPRPGEPSPLRENYLGVLGGVSAGMSESAGTLGEVRIELAGRYTAFQVGPSFGAGIMALRAAIMGHVPFQPTSKYPLFLLPTISVSYSYGWLDEVAGVNPRQQDLSLTPGLRLRYDVIPRLAVLLDLVQVQITFLRLQSSETEDVHRVDAVPVSWNIHAGFAFLY